MQLKIQFVAIMTRHWLMPGAGSRSLVTPWHKWQHGCLIKIRCSFKAFHSLVLSVRPLDYCNSLLVCLALLQSVLSAAAKLIDSPMSLHSWLSNFNNCILASSLSSYTIQSQNLGPERSSWSSTEKSVWIHSSSHLCHIPQSTSILWSAALHCSWWNMVAHWLRRLLSTGGSWVRLPL